MTQPPTPEALTYAVKGLGYELDGVIIDTEEGGGFDAICLKTVKRVRAALAALASQSRPAADEASERERFEARFPVPAGVRWIGDGYECDERRENSYLCERFMARWIAWLAAKADMSTPAPGWRPIESAPKDVAPILLWMPPIGGWLAGAWRGSWSFVEEEWVIHTPLLTANGKIISLTQIPSPTHWQPLPNPPAESTDGLAKAIRALASKTQEG